MQLRRSHADGQLCEHPPSQTCSICTSKAGRYPGGMDHELHPAHVWGA